MSRLDTWNAEVILHAEEKTTDSDGNPSRKAAREGVPVRVLIQPLPQSGTSSRRSEQDNEGFETEQVYRMRFRRREDRELGPTSYIIWEGEKWGIFGHPLLYNSSPRTAHYDYKIIRS